MVAATSTAGIVYLCFVLLCLLASSCDGVHAAALTHHHRRSLRMNLYLTNETVPVEDLPADQVHDNPLVKDAGTAGNDLPPRHPIRPLTALELLQKPTHEYMAMCLVTSDAGVDVREWMDHYLKLGVGRIYVFDHSENSIVASFADLVHMGVVEYQIVPDRGAPWRQFFIYETCLQRYRARHQWIAFFDSDEFLMIKDPKIPDLPAFLTAFEKFGGLSVNWRVFGSHNLIKRPVGSVVANYLSCTPKDAGINTHVKSIVNTRYAASHANNPHAFIYQPGYYAVNEHGVQIPTGHGTSRGAVTPGAISTDILALYHYTTKSIEEYTLKVMRGSVNKTPGKTLRWFQDLDAECTETCDDGVALMASRKMPDLSHRVRAVGL